MLVVFAVPGPGQVVVRVFQSMQESLALGDERLVPPGPLVVPEAMDEDDPQPAAERTPGAVVPEVRHLADGGKQYVLHDVIGVLGRHGVPMEPPVQQGGVEVNEAGPGFAVGPVTHPQQQSAGGVGHDGALSGTVPGPASVFRRPWGRPASSSPVQAEPPAAA